VHIQTPQQVIRMTTSERAWISSSVPRQKTRRQIRLSDAALVRKMKSYYGPEPLPSSEEIWGCDIFTEALNRGREAAKAE